MNADEVVRQLWRVSVSAVAREVGLNSKTVYKIRHGLKKPDAELLSKLQEAIEKCKDVVPSRLAKTHCVTCGEKKPSGAHPLVQRCDACHKEFSDAMFAANRAIARERKCGRIAPASRFACVDCGDKALDYDHRDYSKPLDVEPVCRACNLRRGPALFSRLVAA